MKKELISDILFEWENDISTGCGHNHRDSVAKRIIELCQPKWISVETELPEGGKDVLTVDYEGEQNVAYFSESKKNWYDWEGILRIPHNRLAIFTRTARKNGDRAANTCSG